MLKTSVISIFCILIITTVSPVYAVSDWDRAVEVYSESAELKPYRMVIFSETYDGKGNLEKTEEQVYRLSYDSSGETVQQLLRATEDGKDITVKKLRELEKNDGKSRGGPPEGTDTEGMQKHPLDPGIQEDVYAVNTGRSEYRNNQYCTVWEFKIRLNDKYNGIGTVWINKQNGQAVSIEYRIEPLFPFVEEMNIGLEYKTGDSRQWVLDQLKMSGKVNMLIIKRRFEAITSFSDYR